MEINVYVSESVQVVDSIIRCVKLIVKKTVEFFESIGESYVKSEVHTIHQVRAPPVLGINVNEAIKTKDALR